METQDAVQSSSVVRITLPVPHLSSRAWAVAWLAGTAAVALFFTLVFPSIAVRFVLPLTAMLATVSVRVLCMRVSARLLTFDAQGIRFESSGFDRRVPWSDIARIAITKAALVIHDVHGVPTRVPWSVDPDVRAILALAPKSVGFESREAEPSKGRARFTLLLWLVLIVMMTAIYSLFAHGPPP